MSAAERESPPQGAATILLCYTM